LLLFLSQLLLFYYLRLLYCLKIAMGEISLNLLKHAFFSSSILVITDEGIL